MDNSTRPCSNTAICNAKRPNEIFAKDEDLYSLSECQHYIGMNDKSISLNAILSKKLNIHQDQIESKELYAEVKEEIMKRKLYK